MSLPNAVLRLSTDVLAEINDDERLAFAYAHGPALSGFGEEAELVCVWETDTVPADASDEAVHLTVARFQAHMEALDRGEGWRHPGDEALHVIARFAEGTLLADDSELGSQARAEVTEFPQALAIASREAVAGEVETLAKRLGDASDPWELAETLTEGLHHAYVALFAAGGYFFPGHENRAAFVERYLLGDEVPEAEAAVWTAASAPLPERAEALPAAWRALARTVLDNC
ncbi:hypothetical protein [Glycomyces tritici]|uniref:Uncharacterized protein n=1 Tax=Glycomyces tritici TaxID=2665176 RepID=A0ABT7YY40_9ACTN|nr:hypothetical protein [Glycomyces tritici]MDN3241251.1 hypothetical protein [Glycomyces tritici]MDN3243274.1 hypothetical protein [Glycomyces tritici]